jgi:hypothetical protein
MTSRHRFETLVLACVAAAFVVGIASAFIDVRWFEQVYVVEDGPVEWATAAALLAAAGVAAWTALHPPGERRRLHAVTWLGLVLLCLFAAGEEISWGQRILRFSSPEFFLEHNAQRETNLHNMVVAGIKVNKLVFSQLMTVFAALFLLVLPVLHRRNAALARMVDALGIPVPRLPHVAGVVAVFALIGLIPSRERDELLEFGASAIFFLILLSPRNVAALRSLRRGGEAADAAVPGAGPAMAARGGSPGRRGRTGGTS